MAVFEQSNAPYVGHLGARQQSMAFVTRSFLRLVVSNAYRKKIELVDKETAEKVTRCF